MPGGGGWGGSLPPPDPGRRGRRPCTGRAALLLARAGVPRPGGGQDILACFPSCAWDSVPSPAGPAGQRLPHPPRPQPFKAGLILPRPETELSLGRNNQPARFTICLTKDRALSLLPSWTLLRATPGPGWAPSTPFLSAAARLWSLSPRLPLQSQLEPRSPGDTGQFRERLGPCQPPGGEGAPSRAPGKPRALPSQGPPADPPCTEDCGTPLTDGDESGKRLTQGHQDTLGGPPFPAPAPEGKPLSYCPQKPPLPYSSWGGWARQTLLSNFRELNNQNQEENTSVSRDFLRGAASLLPPPGTAAPGGPGQRAHPRAHHPGTRTSGVSAGLSPWRP